MSLVGCSAKCFLPFCRVFYSSPFLNNSLVQNLSIGWFELNGILQSLSVQSFHSSVTPTELYRISNHSPIEYTSFINQ